MSMYWYEYFIIHIETSTYWSVPISRQTVISTCVEISVRRDNGASIQRVNPDGRDMHTLEYCVKEVKYLITRGTHVGSMLINFGQ